MMTVWRYMCPLLAFVQVIVVSDTGALQVCDKMQNQFNVSGKGEKCLEGTVYNSTINCCTGCPVCPPGYRQLPQCKGGCDLCPPNQYSDQDNNFYCKKCTKCREYLNRNVLKNCTKVHDSRCGLCLPGYELDEDSGHPRKCIKKEPDPRKLSTVHVEDLPPATCTPCMPNLCEDGPGFRFKDILIIILSLVILIFAVGWCRKKCVNNPGSQKDEVKSSGPIGEKQDKNDMKKGQEKQDKNDMKKGQALLQKFSQDEDSEAEPTSKEVTAIQPVEKSPEEITHTPDTSEGEIGTSEEPSGKLLVDEDSCDPSHAGIPTSVLEIIDVHPQGSK